MTPPRGLAVPDRLPPWYSLAIAVLVVMLDYAVGPTVEFPGLFVIPVMYAAWYGGIKWGLPLSLLPVCSYCKKIRGICQACLKKELA